MNFINWKALIIQRRLALLSSTPLYRQYYLLPSLRVALFLILTSKMHLSIFSDEETYKHQPKEFDNPWFPRRV